MTRNPNEKSSLSRIRQDLFEVSVLIHLLLQVDEFLEIKVVHDIFGLEKEAERNQPLANLCQFLQDFATFKQFWPLPKEINSTCINKLYQMK